MVGPLLRPRSVWIYLVFITGISFSFTSLMSPSEYAVSFRILSAGQSPHCLCPALIPRWLHTTCRVKPSVSVERAELSLVGALPPHLISPLGALPIDPLESILQPKALLGTLPYLLCCFMCIFFCIWFMPECTYPSRLPCETSYSSFETLSKAWTTS